MKVFIGSKYLGKVHNSQIIESVKDYLKELGHEPYYFGDEGHIADKKEMIQKAMQKIDESDVVLCEATELSFGVGIEAGYAKAKGKRILTIYNSETELSRTIEGVSDKSAAYSDLDSLKELLKALLAE